MGSRVWRGLSLVQEWRGHWERERGLLCQSLGDGVQAEGPAGGRPRGGKACAIRGTAGWGGGRRWRRLAISALGLCSQSKAAALPSGGQAGRSALRAAPPISFPSGWWCPRDAAQRQGLGTLKGMFSRGPWAVTLEKPESWGETSSQLLLGGAGQGGDPVACIQCCHHSGARPFPWPPTRTHPSVPLSGCPKAALRRPWK